MCCALVIQFKLFVPSSHFVPPISTKFHKSNINKEFEKVSFLFFVLSKSWSSKKFLGSWHFSQVFGHFVKATLDKLNSISSTASDQTTTRANLLASSSIVSWAFKRFTPSLRSFVRTSPRFSHFCFWPKPLRQCNLDNPNFNPWFFWHSAKKFLTTLDVAQQLI